ncbi:unnamed protein product [Choristocarpus tenellus]
MTPPLWIMRVRPFAEGLERSCVRQRGLTGVRFCATTSGAQQAPGGGTGVKRPRAMLVNGRAMATDILQEVRREVDLMREKNGTVPGLAVIMVGERRDSAKYVSMKQAVAESVGFSSFSSSFPASATHEDVLRCIQGYNQDPRCHGILLQLPVPPHLDPRGLLGAIKVEKDVECFNPTNAGRLTAWRRTVIAPCTPRGVMEMLLRLGVEVRGKHAVVLGESSVVGLPMCLMLNEARATVSMVHKDTPNPEDYVRRADILVAATGVPELVRPNWVKPGAVVVDVGINFVRDESRPEGFRVVGDVHPGVRMRASIVSPVPGGVGPMTVAMLMRNCVDMAFLHNRWDDIAGVLHQAHTVENARRMHSAIVDLSLVCKPRQTEKDTKFSASAGVRPEVTPEDESGAYLHQPHSKSMSRDTPPSHSSGGTPAPGPQKESSPGDMEDALLRQQSAQPHWTQPSPPPPPQVPKSDVLERAGEGISDAELLTIINDTERNAFGLLSFLELGSSHDRSLGARDVGELVDEKVGPCSEDTARHGCASGSGEREGGKGWGWDRRAQAGEYLESGEERSMRELDEWHQEAERAAERRGERVLPTSKGKELLAEHLESFAEGHEWWVRDR